MAAAPQIPWPEHPRPDFHRSPWVNLNGEWEFDFDPNDVGEKEQWFAPGGHSFQQRIVVPFPWESNFSGIGDTEYKGVAWYSRRVVLPAGEGWDGRDAWLVIGACDWEAKVWVNGEPAAEHVGGYVPFNVNLSAFARPGEEVMITIRAVDVTNDQQPTGKQVHWYTRTSGIWQTVYLEPRGETHIRGFRLATKRGGPSPETDWTVTCDVAVIPKIDGGRTELHFDTRGGRVNYWGPGQIRGVIGNGQPWHPDDPHLYDARLVLKDAEGKVLDEVQTYFGLREVSVGKAPGRDYQYILLNGRPIYLRGALHQSFHPDGIYQYPDDAVMRSDYELCKRIGLNFLRIHIKAPVPRELYWADRLGVLIMQDMPNYWKHTDQAVKWYEQMLPAVIERDFNHPAVFSWCDFNETWGIGDGGYSPARREWVKTIYEQTKKLDPTRLVEDNSPCNYDHVATDINSWHFYINDYEGARNHIREVVEKTHPGSAFNYAEGYQQDDDPLINSEYGGISAGLGDQDISWCFKYLTNELRLHDKICGYVYTELSDIEWEHNGFVNYDRSDKEYGYHFWHPNFSLKDINAPDFVVIDAPPCVELKPGERREVPIRVSHWSDREGKALSLRWRTDWLDRWGKRHEGQWRSRAASWKPFEVTDLSPVEVAVDEDGPGLVGALLVELVDDTETIARNYINLLADRSPAPRVEAVDAQTVALRFSPGDFAACTFADAAEGRRLMSADKVYGRGRGAIEYRLRLPKDLKIENLTEFKLLAELASKAGDEKLDWPDRKKPFDYPQTDVKTWPSDVRLVLNGRPVATLTLPDDPADARGALSHHRGHRGSYGYLVSPTVSGDELAAVKDSFGTDPLLRIRLEVPADAAHAGGLAVFGAGLGCYPVDPTLELKFERGHGLDAGFRSEEAITVDRVQRVLLPTAECGRQEWRYTTDRPDDDWAATLFDDGAWRRGHGGFGARGTPNAIIGTRWNTPDIWLRTKVTIDDPKAIQSAWWRLYHDEDVEIFINGTKALTREKHVADYIDLPLDPAALAALRPGENMIAVHCRQTGGGQNIDVGLVASSQRP